MTAKQKVATIMKIVEITSACIEKNKYMKTNSYRCSLKHRIYVLKGSVRLISHLKWKWKQLKWGEEIIKQKISP